MASLSIRVESGMTIAVGDFGRNPDTGKRWRKRKSFPGVGDEERRAAQEWFDLTMRGLENGTLWTVGELLTRYIDRRRDLAPNSVRTYRLFARRYAARIGGLYAPDVTTPMLNDLFGRLLDAGAEGGEPLSPNTVGRFRFFLQRAFEWFVDERLIDRNPVRKTMRIRTEHREMHALDPDSYSRVKAWIVDALAAEPTDEYGIKRRNCAFAIWLALVTGIREGEACAIRRRDVRLRGIERSLGINGNVVIISGRAERQDKTKGRRSRNIALTDANVATISAHMRWQDGYLATRGLDTPLITTDGTFVRPDALRAEFRRMVRETGIPAAYHFHTLRHTHATYLLEDGVDPKTVQERLGHARAETTLDNYGHVMPGRDQRAAEVFEQAWESA